MTNKMNRRESIAHASAFLAFPFFPFFRKRKSLPIFASPHGLVPSSGVTQYSLSHYSGGKKPLGNDIDLISILKAACLDGTKQEWNVRRQVSGLCVGSAAASCADIVMGVYWLTRNKNFSGRASAGALYAGSRVEAAERPGSWRGSNGSWVAEYVTGWGIALLKDLELPETSWIEDGNLGIKWTRKRDGVPDAIEKLSKNRPIIKAPFIGTTDEAAVAIEAGAPIIACSPFIPRGRKLRDGTYKTRKESGHATVICGCRYVNKKRQWRSLNSWGKDWKDEGFAWISDDDAQSGLDYRDSYAFVGMNGLEPLTSLSLLGG